MTSEDAHDGTPARVRGMSRVWEASSREGRLVKTHLAPGLRGRLLNEDSVGVAQMPQSIRGNWD